MVIEKRKIYLKNKFYLFFFTLFLILINSNVTAKNEFKYQIDLNKSKFSSNAFFRNSSTASLTLYRMALISGNYPYAETAFIDRSSSIALSTEYIFLDFASDNIISTNGSIQLTYSENQLPVTFSVYYLKQGGSGEINTINVESNENIMFAEMGWYLKHNASIVTRYVVLSNDVSFSGQRINSLKSKIFEASFNYLFSFSNRQYLKIESSIARATSINDDNLTAIQIKFSNYEVSQIIKFFFNKSFSIQIGGAKDRTLNPDKDGGYQFSFGMSKYYTSTTSMNFEISGYKADQSNNDRDFDVLSFSLSHRF